VGPRAVLDAVVKRKFPIPRRESKPDRPARIQSVYRLSYPGSRLNVLVQIMHRNSSLNSVIMTYCNPASAYKLKYFKESRRHKLFLP
jgi:hypothetical protein